MTTKLFYQNAKTNKFVWIMSYGLGKSLDTNCLIYGCRILPWIFYCLIFDFERVEAEVNASPALFQTTELLKQKSFRTFYSLKMSDLIT